MKKNQTHTLSTAKRSPLMAAGATVALTAALAMGAPSTALADEAEPGDGNAAPSPDGQQQPVESNAQTETKTVPASVLDENAEGEITVTETTTESDPVVVTDEKKNADGSTTITTTTTTVTEKDLTVEGQATTKTDGEVDIEGTPLYFAGLNEGDVVGDYTVTSKVASEDGSAITVVLTKALDPTSGAIDAEELAKILGEGYTVEAGEDGSFIINGKEHIVSTNVDNTSSTRAVTISLKKSDASYVVSQGSGEDAEVTSEASLDDAKKAAEDKAKKDAIAAVVADLKAKYDEVITDANGNPTKVKFEGHYYVVTVETNSNEETAVAIEGIPEDAIDVEGWTVTVTATPEAKASWSTTKAFKIGSQVISGKVNVKKGDTFNGATVDSVVEDQAAGTIVIKTIATKDGEVTTTEYVLTYKDLTQDELSELKGKYSEIVPTSLKKVSWTSEATTIKTVSEEKQIDSIEVRVDETLPADKSAEAIARARAENEAKAKAALTAKLKEQRAALAKEEAGSILLIKDKSGKQVGAIAAATTDAEIAAMVESWNFDTVVDDKIVYEDKTPAEIQAMIEEAKAQDPNYAKYSFCHVDIDQEGTLIVTTENGTTTVDFDLSDAKIFLSHSAAEVANHKTDSATWTFADYPTTRSQDGTRWEFLMPEHGYAVHAWGSTTNPGSFTVQDSFYQLVGKITYIDPTTKEQVTKDFVTYGYLGRSSNDCQNQRPGTNAGTTSGGKTLYYGYDLALGNIVVDKDGKISVLTIGKFDASIKTEKVIKVVTPDQGEGLAGDYKINDVLTPDAQSATATYGDYKLWEQDAKAEDTAVRDLNLVAKNTTATVKTKSITITPDDPRPVPDPDPDPTPDPDPKDLDLPQTGDTLPMGAAGGMALASALLVAFGLRRRFRKN